MNQNLSARALFCEFVVYPIKSIVRERLVRLAENFVDRHQKKSDLPDPEPSPPKAKSVAVVGWPPTAPTLPRAYTENYYYVREDSWSIAPQPDHAMSTQLREGARLKFTGLAIWNIARNHWEMTMCRDSIAASLDVREGDPRTFVVSSKHIRPGEEIPKDPTGSGAQA